MIFSKINVGAWNTNSLVNFSIVIINWVVDPFCLLITCDVHIASERERFFFIFESLRKKKKKLSYLKK